MALFDSIKKAFKPSSNNKTPKVYGNIFMDDLGIVGWDEARESYWIEEGYQKNPTVQSIVQMASKNAGSLKWVIKRRDNNELAKRVSPVLKEMLYKPNTLQTWNDFIQEAVGWKMLNGNLFLWGMYPEDSSSLNRGKYQYIFQLPSHLVQIKFREDGMGIESYNLDFMWTDDDISADDVYHVKSPNFDYDETGTHFYGQSPLLSCRRSIDVNNQCIDAMQSLMKSLGPPGILGMKGEGAAKMNETQLKKIKQQLKSFYQGAVNFGDFPVNNMEWIWTQLGSDPSKLEIQKVYKQSQQDIANAFNFPVSLLDGQTAFANQTEAKKAMWENCILPTLDEIRDALNCWWIPQFGSDIYIDYDVSTVKALNEDFDMKANSVMKLRGVLTPNELRRELGYDPIAGGDQLEDTNRFAEGMQQSVAGGAGADQNADGDG